MDEPGPTRRIQHVPNKTVPDVPAGKNGAGESRGNSRIVVEGKPVRMVAADLGSTHL